MQDRSFLQASKLTIVMLTVVALIGCSGGPVSQPPPQGPSGIIVVTPATSATAVFKLGTTGQTFVASELGYSGGFSFTDTVTFGGHPGTLSPATTPSSVTLKPDIRCILVCYNLLQTVVVHDSLGSTTKVYAQ